MFMGPLWACRWHQFFLSVQVLVWREHFSSLLERLLTLAFTVTPRSGASAMGSFMVIGLFGLIIAMVVNIFLGSTQLEFVLVGGVLIFAGLTAWDTQRINHVFGR